MQWDLVFESETKLIVHLCLMPNTAFESEALRWLDSSELERRSRFVHPRPRRQFTLCRGVLRLLACRQLCCRNEELSFASSEFGKPYALVDGERAKIAFNISHSGGHGMIAMTPDDCIGIGIDVEERSTDRDLDFCIRSLFAARERRLLERMQGNQKVELFYRLWTLKEALVKATGEGLSRDTAKFEIPLSLMQGDKVSDFSFSETPSVRWRLENIGNEQYAAAIAREIASS